MFRTVLETTRTLFVWLVDLVLFYTPLGMGTLGESWSTYSLIQAAGCGPQCCAFASQAVGTSLARELLAVRAVWMPSMRSRRP